MVSKQTVRLCATGLTMSLLVGSVTLLAQDIMGGAGGGRDIEGGSVAVLSAPSSAGKKARRIEAGPAPVRKVLVSTAHAEARNSNSRPAVTPNPNPRTGL